MVFSLSDDEHIWNNDGDARGASQDPEYENMEKTHSGMGPYF